MSTHNASVVVSAAGVVPYLQGRAGDQHSNHAISTHPSASFSCDRQPAPPGTLGGCHPQGQGYSLGITHSGLGPPPPKPPGGVYTSAGQHSSSDGCPLASMVSTKTHTHKKVSYAADAFFFEVKNPTQLMVILTWFAYLFLNALKHMLISVSDSN